MKVTYLGHSAFLLEGSHRVLFDPFLTGNDTAALPAEQVEADAILLTHGHGDHVGDAVPIARRLNIPIVAIYELATYLSWEGVQTHGQNIGGAGDYPFGRVKLVRATHSTGSIDEAGRSITYCGEATGIVYTADGKTIYHVGDSGLTTEFELIGRRHSIDLAFVPIGDYFTMGPEDAAEAVRMMGARRVVPCHYNTFPPIRQDPDAFVRAVGDAAEVTVLAPGEALHL